MQKLGPQARFAANMRRIRGERGVTQAAVARAAGLHPSYIGSVERGERNVTISNIEKIATALGVPMAALLMECSPV